MNLQDETISTLKEALDSFKKGKIDNESFMAHFREIMWLVCKASQIAFDAAQIGTQLSEHEKRKRKIKSAIFEIKDGGNIIVAGDRIFIEKPERSWWHRLTRKDYCLKEIK